MVSPPADRFWRVTDWNEPFDPPPPPAPLGTIGGGEDDSGRFDAPDGSFRTLYCATEPEGAIGEKLADFAQNSAAARRIEAFVVGEGDPGYEAEDLTVRLGAADIDGLEWILASARPLADARFIDLWHWRTLVAALPLARGLLTQFHLKLDRRALLDERRGFTRRLAGLIRHAAEPPAANGLRFESRLPPAWECWALWEPVPIDEASIDGDRVTISTPALRRAASMLAVALAE
jgi:RES domain